MALSVREHGLQRLTGGCLLDGGLQSFWALALMRQGLAAMYLKIMYPSTAVTMCWGLALKRL